MLALPTSTDCLNSLRQAPYLSSDFLVCKTVIDSTYFTGSLYSLCFVLVGPTNHRPRTLCLQSRWVESVNVERMKVKEESEKVGLKLNIQQTKIMASDPII